VLAAADAEAEEGALEGELGAKEVELALAERFAAGDALLGA
jgi:hypothetical protein